MTFNPEGQGFGQKRLFSDSLSIYGEAESGNELS